MQATGGVIPGSSDCDGFSKFRVIGQNTHLLVAAHFLVSGVRREGLVVVFPLDQVRVGLLGLRPGKSMLLILLLKKAKEATAGHTGPRGRPHSVLHIQVNKLALTS